MAENIYTSISNIMHDIGAVGKDKKHQQGYQYRGIDDVMNALQPQLAKHKVVIVPEVMEQLREERTTAKGGLLLYSILKIKFKFYAEDGTSVEAVTIGEAFDSGDKASNKAMAIAFKYACFQVFCIATEEMLDPDDCAPHDIAPAQYMDDARIVRIEELRQQANLSEKVLLSSIKKSFGCNAITDLQREQYTQITDFLKATIETNKNKKGDVSLV